MEALSDLTYEELRELVPTKASTTRVPTGDVFRLFLRLGACSFGGPGSHLEIQRQELVERKGWLSSQGFLETVGMCHFLPGVSSSQVGVAAGARVAGLPGALAAWLGFLLPSALVMAFLGTLTARIALRPNPAWIHGLEIFACVLLARAVWTLGRSQWNDLRRVGVLLATATASFLAPPGWGPVASLSLGALAGLLFLTPEDRFAGCRFAGRGRGGCHGGADTSEQILSRSLALASLTLFVVMLVLLEFWKLHNGSLLTRLTLGFYEMGGTVFGSGQMILPLVQSHMVAQGLIPLETFLVGYGLAQVLPGPTFSMAAFLGGAVAGWAGAALATLAIFLPGLLLMIAVLPLWSRIRKHHRAQRALTGVNAAVTGLLLCAFYHMTWGGGISAPVDLLLAAAALSAFALGRISVWPVALALSLAGALFLGPSSWISRFPLDGTPKVQAFLGLPVKKSVVRLVCPKGRIGVTGRRCALGQGEDSNE